MTRNDVLHQLRRGVDHAGSVRSYAKLIRLPEATVRRALGGTSEPSDRVLTALGLRRVERYEVAG